MGPEGTEKAGGGELMRHKRESGYEPYRCRAEAVLLTTVHARSPEEAEGLLQDLLAAIEDDYPGLLFEGMWVD
ncbi:hypothetical protein [Eubacterium callanderi]|uniref:hypothetical protein n=1 Tax=Eubacterium callanderi TaxID=53442 RepID=UPI001160CDDD|nr:hypothetical protein [Eubacterium callanderi]